MTIQLTEKDNNTVVKVKKGEEVDIILPANSSTGFFWQATDTSAGRLQRLQYDAQTKAGAATLARFRFLVEDSGHFTLNYARPWAELTPPARWFDVVIDTEG